MTKRVKGDKPDKGKKIRETADPDAWKGEKICVLYSSFDDEGAWGVSGLQDCDWRDVFRKLENYQTMTWAEILRATGAVKAGNNHHSIETQSLSNAAIKRLEALQIDSDTIFSFHLTGTLRVYGIRSHAKFSALWVDPWHADAAKGVCPSSKRHT
jgi:hypothetical protein